jgi:hypothetical protein
MFPVNLPRQRDVPTSWNVFPRLQVPEQTADRHQPGLLRPVIRQALKFGSNEIRYLAEMEIIPTDNTIWKARRKQIEDYSQMKFATVWGLVRGLRIDVVHSRPRNLRQSNRSLLNWTLSSPSRPFAGKESVPALC